MAHVSDQPIEHHFAAKYTKNRIDNDVLSKVGLMVYCSYTKHRYIIFCISSVDLYIYYKRCSVTTSAGRGGKEDLLPSGF